MDLPTMLAMIAIIWLVTGTAIIYMIANIKILRRDPVSVVAFLKRATDDDEDSDVSFAIHCKSRINKFLLTMMIGLSIIFVVLLVHTTMFSLLLRRHSIDILSLQAFILFLEWAFFACFLMLALIVWKIRSKIIEYLQLHDL